MRLNARNFIKRSILTTGGSLALIVTGAHKQPKTAKEHPTVHIGHSRMTVQGKREIPFAVQLAQWITKGISLLRYNSSTLDYAVLRSWMLLRRLWRLMSSWWYRRKNFCVFWRHLFRRELYSRRKDSKPCEIYKESHQWKYCHMSLRDDISNKHFVLCSLPESLRLSATEFDTSSRRLKRKLCWQNVKVRGCLSVMLVCGIDSNVH